MTMTRPDGTVLNQTEWLCQDLSVVDIEKTQRQAMTIGFQNGATSVEEGVQRFAAEVSDKFEQISSTFLELSEIKRCGEQLLRCMTR